jgi:hypothetical protein
MKTLKNTTAKRVAVGAIMGGGLLMSAGLGLANADSNDGKVDVRVGNAGILEDVSVADAAQIAAGVCNVDVNQVNRLAQDVDSSGNLQNVCNNNLGAVEFGQNQPGHAAGAPGQQPNETATPTTSAAPGAATTTTPTTTTTPAR